MNPRSYSTGAATEEDRIRDKYARRKPSDSRYSWFNPGQVFMLQERERRLLELLKRAGVDSLKETRILEIGCGQGSWLRDLIKWGAQPQNLTGIELLPDRADEARRLCPSGVQVVCGSAAQLEFPAESFDLVLQSTVFTSIQEDGLKAQIAAEMMRVVRSNGLILWYDFRVNNPRNPDVTGVGKSEILKLFPGRKVDLFSITLIPALVRNLAPWSWLSCHLLAKVPWLRTHYFGLIRK
jgi:ubiquinone/menaquinone biosynthesis C-methylase UbiE